MTRPRKNRLEWAVFAVGTLLVLATLGYLVSQSLARGNDPPALEVRLGDPRPSPGGFVVPVEVRNRGATTAEQVQVAVLLDRGTGRTEEATLTIDFLPRHSRRNGWVTLRAAPARARLRVGPVSYLTP